MQDEVIKVSIVEDDDEVRELLQMIIHNSPGFTCEAVFRDAESAIEKLPEIYPNVVLQDVQLPGINGIECIGRLREKLPQTDFIMLTVLQDDETIFSALKAGASGYLLKDTPPAQLLESIKEVTKGGSPMSPSIARRVIASFHPASQSPLSDRETEILSLMVDGKEYAEIGEQLFISGHTVRAHIKNIYRKLEVNSKAEAVKTAINKRLI